MTIFESKHVNKPLPCPHARNKNTNDKVCRKIVKISVCVCERERESEEEREEEEREGRGR